MGIFDIFKNKKSGRIEKKVSIAVEDQLKTLLDIGIKPKHQEFIEWVCAEWGRESLENDPYNLLIFALGVDGEINNVWEPLSDSVYCFDTECVDDNSSYAEVFLRLSALSKGVFDIFDVKSIVNHDEKEAEVNFIYKGDHYAWNLEYDNDWFDCSVIAKINELLKRNNSLKYFYTSSPDQNLYVVFFDEEKIAILNKVTTVPFARYFSDHTL